MVKSKVINIGDLVYVPRIPLALWSRLGDPSFWKVGVVLNVLDAGDLLVYSDSDFDRIHTAHTRSVL